MHFRSEQHIYRPGLVLVAAKEQRDRQKPPTGEVEGEDRGEGLGGGAADSKSVETGIQTNNML